MKYAVFLILILLLGCKNNNNSVPKPTYTIKGRVLNGSTGQTYANQPVSAEVHTATKPSTSADLGTGMTDADGNFSISYTQTSINYSQASILINSNFFQLDGIPVNKNIDSTFYLSSMGSIKVYLQPKTLFTSSDTLFLGFALLNSGGGVTGIEIDTIFTAVQGYYKTVKYPTPSIGIYYARGWSNLGYDPNRQVFRGNKSSEITFKITGDPYVDIGTINY